MCVSLLNFVVISQTVPEIWRTIFWYFQNGDRSPSWICYEHVWTTHEEYLVVFITVQI